MFQANIMAHIIWVIKYIFIALFGVPTVATFTPTRCIARQEKYLVKRRENERYCKHTMHKFSIPTNVISHLSLAQHHQMHQLYEFSSVLQYGRRESSLTFFNPLPQKTFAIEQRTTIY